MPPVAPLRAPASGDPLSVSAIDYKATFSPIVSSELYLTGKAPVSLRSPPLGKAYAYFLTAAGIYGTPIFSGYIGGIAFIAGVT